MRSVWCVNNRKYEPVLLNPKASTSIGLCLFAGGRVSMSLDCEVIVNDLAVQSDESQISKRDLEPVCR